MTDAPHHLEAARLDKLAKIEQLGIDPWGQRFDGHLHIAAAREKCPAEQGVDGESVRVAGRLVRWSDSGKLRFGHIQDYTGKIQIAVSMKDVDERTWQLVDCLDRGDNIGVDGVLKLTKTGEKTVFAKSLVILGKSLANPPEKWHGLED
ncbi:MAG: OB-fold nucleic acid binding domain-containing protein, partial [Planctomycetaceae bacterium]|nr:OB-fold nucleic acid binding domain-containing protein [Planctomycetaceae bacterium]